MYGTYSYAMDKKGRVFIPAKLREELGDNFFICKNLTGSCCLSIYSQEEWKRLSEQLRLLPKSKAQLVRRFIFPTAAQLTYDATGRVIIPEELRVFAKLDKDVAFIGMEDHAELWDETALRADQEAISPEEIAALLEELGF